MRVLGISLLAIIATCAVAEAASPSPVAQCESLPSTANWGPFSTSDVVPLCRQVLRVLEGVTVDDLLTFEKAAYLFSRYGYEAGDYAEITAELVDIIRLRGLYNQQPRWRPTIDIALKSYQAFNGIVSPQDIVSILKSSGPMAKTLSDRGLTSMIIGLKIQRQQGDD